jgi:hypothetical protein
MAGEVLLSISRDETERARLESEYKYEVDRQSFIVEARREGEAEALVAVARKMKQDGQSTGKIREYTQLAPEEIEKL